MHDEELHKLYILRNIVSVIKSRTMRWVGPNQPPIRWLLGALSLGVKTPKREADHTLQSSAEVNNSWNHTSTPSIRLHCIVHKLSTGTILPYVARMRGMRNVHEISVGKPEEKRPVGRPRRRWEDNIWMDLREIGWKDVGWTHLTQDKYQWRVLVNTVMNLRIPLQAGNFLTSWVTSNLSRRTLLHGLS
jgi:hypothetical protein